MPLAKDIMVKKIVSISENSSMSELSSILIKSKMSGLPVIDKGGELVGFVSERDVITSLAQSSIMKKKVKDIMTKKVISVKKETSVEEISKIFSEKSIRCLPVLDGGRLVGTILRKAVIDRLLGYYY